RMQLQLPAQSLTLRCGCANNVCCVAGGQPHADAKIKQLETRGHKEIRQTKRPVPDPVLHTFYFQRTCLRYLTGTIFLETETFAMPHVRKMPLSGPKWETVQSNIRIGCSVRFGLFVRRRRLFQLVHWRGKNSRG